MMFNLFSAKGHTCPMCDGKGKVQDGAKYQLRLGEAPSKCDPNELAVVMAISATVATLAEKLGVDPTQIKVDFGFSHTGHHMCFMLGKSEKKAD